MTIPARETLTRILFVCTANIVRSPMAAALLQARLESVGVDAIVESSGLLESDRRIAVGAVRALSRYAIDVRCHRSRTLDAATIESASLILGLERAHVREIVLLVPSAWQRAFTLKELVRRGEAMSPRQPGESLELWLARAHAGRSRHHLVGLDLSDDVLDSYGSPDKAYQETASEIDDLVGRLLPLAWPTER